MGARMTNAPRHARSGLKSLAAPADITARAAPVAALGQFWYARAPLWPIATSIVLHGCVAAILVWTVGNLLERPSVPAESAFFLPPVQPSSPATGGKGGMLAMLSLSGFHDIAADGSQPGDDGSRGRGAGKSDSSDRSRRTRAADTTGAVADNVYTSYQVDNAVQISYGSAVPEYPRDLLARRVEGSVMVRFVVDTSGSADTASIQILDSSDPAFTASVRAALPRMRFSPARLNGQRVRQLVEQPFRFNVQLPAPNPADSSAAGLLPSAEWTAPL